jgi:hypothetical protein
VEAQQLQAGLRHIHKCGVYAIARRSGHQPDCPHRPRGRLAVVGDLNHADQRTAGTEISQCGPAGFLRALGLSFFPARDIPRPRRFNGSSQRSGQGGHEWELFDLEKDPNELKSVYGDPAYAEVQTQMLAELNRLQAKYGDSLEKAQELVKARRATAKAKGKGKQKEKKN